jgi:hypothetical protein
VIRLYSITVSEFLLSGLLLGQYGAVTVSCWPGQPPLVHRRTLAQVRVTVSIDTFLIPGSFEVSGGGDFEYLRSALLSDDVPSVPPNALDTLEERNENTEEYRIFRRRDDYVFAVIRRSMK